MKLLISTSVLAITLTGLILGNGAIASGQEKPNVVMIISDDQAWTDYSFMGHESIKTPHLDQLARQSVVFRRGYVPTALCRPSLMTMITGHYAHHHGITGNDPSPKYAAPQTELNHTRRGQLIANVDQHSTLPRRLADAGYLCHQSGKWWEGSFQRGGFTHGMTRGFPEKGGRHGDDGLKIGREGLAAVTDFIDMSIEEKKPFFIWYAPFLPHTPHNPPKRLLAKYSVDGRPITIAKYYAMCDWFDETCGQLIEHLDKTNVRDNTLIVYACDNGWIQSPDSRRYAPRSKQTPYEGGIRTPIMFSWPTKIKPAMRTELCSTIDLAPTILAATQLPQDNTLPGLNLLPNLMSASPIERKTIFGESFAHDIADINNPEASLIFRWCITGKWKLLLTYDGEVNRYQSTHPRTEKRPQLFDLNADPTELKNVAADHPELVASMAAEIKNWYPLTERKTITEF
ncbi:MAG: sulfatase [Mariniblastus sp.]|nr:sulfatase [Mariniblastus sp.]